MRRLLVIGAFPVAGLAQPPERPLEQVELRPGMVISRSVRIAPRVYRFPGQVSLDSAIVTLAGNDITVDFTGATLEGLEPAADPDQATGVAIRVAGGRNVRVVNPRVRGYRFGIIAIGTHHLRIEGGDLSYNWKPRLFSLVEHESLVDWLSYHKNDKDEWLRFGAAIYLDGVRGGEIRGVRAEQGMNGLLMARTDSVRVWNNVFSFNSGLGIGMYRSSDNRILHNHVEFNVRGYSHGFFRRGQDSAGILVFEQCSRNVFAWNSVTHGGDGFFLWAGQTTMDSGAGGANDNLVYGNDFSFAPTNGIEATFSRNTFIANRVEGSDHGVWGGYSYASVFAGNRFSRNRIGIAIEHGQDNVIESNAFDADSTAISLWANPIEPSDWGYPRHRDTRGRDVRVAENLFSRNRVGVRARSTSGLKLEGNRFANVDSVVVLDDSTAAGTVRRDAPPVDASAAPVVPAQYARLAPARLRGGLYPAASTLARMDRSAIVVDDWGPFDWRSPKLWPVDSARALPLRLRVLGPPGRWHLAEYRGVGTMSADEGRVGDTIIVSPSADSGRDWEITLEYIGDSTRSPRGERRAAGVPVRFSYARFEPRTDWRIRIFDTSSDSAREPDMSVVTARMPILTPSESRLDYEWYRPVKTGIPRERWALQGTARVVLPTGTYTLRAISDDGIRVWIDGALVIDHWTSHESAVDSVPIAGGGHDLRVQYYQRDGWTELRVEIVRGTQMSTGSPGPH